MNKLPRLLLATLGLPQRALARLLWHPNRKLAAKPAKASHNESTPISYYVSQSIGNMVRDCCVLRDILETHDYHVDQLRSDQLRWLQLECIKLGVIDGTISPRVGPPPGDENTLKG
jgi:hypothetical protein